METVAIFGVGLIGGSFALALRKAGFTGRILGVSSPATLSKALEQGAIDEGATLESAAKRADLIYLAQPISRILELLPELDRWVRPDALITDAGSTKAAIVAKAGVSINRCQFLGGHPLAGKESRGVESADADLFRGRTYVLTPKESVNNCQLETPAATDFITWLQRLGSSVLVMDAATHDRTLAYTSHLPQLASTALADLLGRPGVQVERVFGPALLDSTRLALSPFDVWADILATNTKEIDTALAAYIDALTDLRFALTSADAAKTFQRAFAFASELRASRASGQ